ncbi:hypothetical protein ABW21_db0203801 [Orbilia brochopaga]|nr:hypothetical protein ABW21_db0203801 [Drechslerella brochopaga]
MEEAPYQSKLISYYKYNDTQNHEENAAEEKPIPARAAPRIYSAYEVVKIQDGTIVMLCRKLKDKGLRVRNLLRALKIQTDCVKELKERIKELEARVQELEGSDGRAPSSDKKDTSDGSPPVETPPEEPAGSPKFSFLSVLYHALLSLLSKFSSLLHKAVHKSPRQ